MSANDELVVNFREVTGIDEQRARFYLESSGWQLEVLRQIKNSYEHSINKSL